MVIETHSLTKKYNGFTAVNAIDLSVEKGQVYGFLGPNGAGKSTCIKMLTGLVHPTSGSGQVLGKDLGDVNARNKMGYLPEMFKYQEWMKGEDLLNFHTMLYKLPKDKERNKRVLQKVGLVGIENKKVGTYSKGMQQRMGLACALLPDPEILFLDEPTSALDPIGRKEVRDIIEKLKEEGKTIFLNSHLLSEVEAVSDSITIINKGQIIKSGKTKDLLMEKIMVDIECDSMNTETFAKLKDLFPNNKIEGKSENNISNINIVIDNKEEIPTIAKYLVENNIKIYQITPHHETLEMVFLKAVSKEGM